MMPVAPLATLDSELYLHIVMMRFGASICLFRRVVEPVVHMSVSDNVQIYRILTECG